MVVEFLNQGVYNINGKYLKSNKCRFKTDGIYNVLFFPVSKGVPVATRIKMKDGKIIPFVGGEFYDMKNRLKIRLEEKTVQEYIPSKIVFKDSFSVRGTTHTATVLYEGIMRLTIEHKDKIFSRFLPKIEEATVGNYNSVFLVSGMLKKRIYLCVIAYDASEDDYNVLFEKTVDSFQVTEKGILCKRSLYGMLDTVEECLYSYESNGYKLSDRKFKYRTPHIYPENFYPLLFLESVKNEDYALAESLVTEELKGDIKSVGKYLGEYIIPDFEGEQLTNEPEILFKEKGIFYKSSVVFEMEKGKISNIIKSPREEFLLKI